MEAVVEQDLKDSLSRVFGFDKFRGNQEPIIHNLLGRQNTFVIMPTGAGKSLCYQLPAIIQEGTAIVISPLIALMKNQVDQLNAFGINARFLNSTLSKSESNTSLYERQCFCPSEGVFQVAVQGFLQLFPFFIYIFNDSLSRITVTNKQLKIHFAIEEKVLFQTL